MYCTRLPPLSLSFQIYILTLFCTYSVPPERQLGYIPSTRPRSVPLSWYRFSSLCPPALSRLRWLGFGFLPFNTYLRGTGIYLGNVYLVQYYSHRGLFHAYNRRIQFFGFLSVFTGIEELQSSINTRLVYAWLIACIVLFEWLGSKQWTPISSPLHCIATPVKK
jgi:hypothetical protein